MLVCQKLKVSEPGHVTDAVAFFGRQREHTVQGQKQSVQCVCGSFGVTVAERGASTNAN